MNISALVNWNLITGLETFASSTVSFGWVNCQCSHILAYEIPSANGRHCMVETVANRSEIASILRKLYPSLSLPENWGNALVKEGLSYFLSLYAFIKCWSAVDKPFDANISKDVQKAHRAGF
ncbi:cinnamoyl-CoA reductase CAD2-like [Apium graveolens]|uniref:cinnamoyl-CoA reductase CAD2-like n=1 Tax=Apium graveolens TaxID=4045 RepID=UPI003D7B2593